MKCCKLSRFFNEISLRKKCPYFPPFGLNTGQNNSKYGNFSGSACKQILQDQKRRRRRNFDFYLILISGKLRFLNIKNMFHEYRSSSPEMFCKNGILKSFAKFTRKHLCRSLILKKKTVVFKLTKKRLRSRCFSVSFAKFLRTSVLKIFCKWLLTITICFMKIGSLLYRDKKI